MKRLLILTALTLTLLLVAQPALHHVTWLTLTLSSSHGDCGSWDALAVVVRVVDGDIVDIEA